jgi:tRNA threonylcarbamoyladenosine biosynthesis protein TsaE
MPEARKSLLGGKRFGMDELDLVSKELMQVSEGLKVWLFYGEMGAGKTTLIKAIGKGLKLEDAVSSPTFSIINEYKGSGLRVFHFDFYRIQREAEAYDMGVEEYFDSGQYCFVEWPERVESLFPLHYMSIRIRESTPTTRTIEYMLT